MEHRHTHNTSNYVNGRDFVYMLSLQMGEHGTLEVEVSWDTIL